MTNDELMDITFDIKLATTLVRGISKIQMRIKTEVKNNIYLAKMLMFNFGSHEEMLQEAADLLVEEIERQFGKKMEIVYDLKPDEMDHQETWDDIEKRSKMYAGN